MLLLNLSLTGKVIDLSLVIYRDEYLYPAALLMNMCEFLSYFFDVIRRCVTHFSWYIGGYFIFFVSFDDVLFFPRQCASRKVN